MSRILWFQAIILVPTTPGIDCQHILVHLISFRASFKSICREVCAMSGELCSGKRSRLILEGKIDCVPVTIVRLLQEGDDVSSVGSGLILEFFACNRYNRRRNIEVSTLFKLC